ncbi:hypothetical protein FA10DRAFT_268178 [Acaromyces ingoldii]|uniref:Uncharacterized protein n=1 Tax=Acaromyces ingoldii TaxID=215250 RepID=A0A316YKA7_9BASI|nr:hypothetical protein FA10DRAFT_268178 [Acaromyces ingoldii]PWN89649.1 hypothetical protein FA10DRAFT_268178 [Acaromyces ingoldii]
MASPTAIPHPETSSHHCASSTPSEVSGGPATLSSSSSSFSSSSYSRSPTNTSPQPLVSPIYTSAGRSAFSLPGPNSAAKSPTTTSWYSAGFSSNSQRIRSPSAAFTSASSFPASSPTQGGHPHSHLSRSVSMSSSGGGEPAIGGATMDGESGRAGSRSSSISSSSFTNEPTTPRAESFSGGGSVGMRGGHQSSLPLSSYDQIKAHRASWGNQHHGTQAWNTWASANSGRRKLSSAFTDGELASAGGGSAVMDEGGGGGVVGGGGVGRLFRKWSVGSSSAGPMTPPSSQAEMPAYATHSRSQSMAIPTSAPATGSPGLVEAEVAAAPRGRGASLSNGSQLPPKRRPSPMGERLLMGHFNAH